MLIFKIGKPELTLWSFLKTISLILLIAIGGTLSVEWFFRTFLLREVRIGYMEGSYQGFPHHRLVEQFTGDDLSIVDRKRSAPSAKDRAFRVAMIGDSVTFGSCLSDKDVTANIMHRTQEVFDVVNYGVPGYGFIEYLAVINNSLEMDEYDLVVVTVSPNDCYPASAGIFPVLTRPDERVVHFNDYEPGWKGTAKRVLFDHLKFLYLILAQGYFLRQDGDAHKVGAYREGLETPLTFEQVSRDLKSRTPTKQWRIQQAIFSDQQVVSKVESVLREIALAVESKGAKVLFVMNYEFAYYVLGEDPYRRKLRGVFEKLGRPYVDLFEMNNGGFTETAYFCDIGHPGPLQSKRVSRVLVDKVLQMLSHKDDG